MVKGVSSERIVFDLDLYNGVDSDVGTTWSFRSRLLVSVVVGK